MAKQPKLCEHRHSELTHPNCFSRFWYDGKDERIGYLDIESSGLEADTGWMLSWSIKTRNNKDVGCDWVTVADIHPESIHKVDRQFDKRLVQSLVDEMKKYTGLVTYYGTGFDIPYIRAKAMAYGIKFPKYSDIAHIDLFYMVRSKMKLSHSSLAASTKILGIAGKTRLDFRYWQLAALGDEDAMIKLVNHNVKDVEILERLHRELEPFGKFIRKSL